MFRKKVKTQPYDKNTKRPIIRASICTGEQVAGFRDLKTGKFEEVMLLRNRGDLEAFMEKYQILEGDIGKEY